MHMINVRVKGVASVVGTQLAHAYGAARTEESIRKDVPLVGIVMMAMEEFDPDAYITFLEEAEDEWAAYWTLFCLQGAKALPVVDTEQRLRDFRVVGRSIRSRRFTKRILYDAMQIPRGIWSDWKQHRLHGMLLRFDVVRRCMLVDIIANSGNQELIGLTIEMSHFLTADQVNVLKAVYKPKEEAEEDPPSFQVTADNDTAKAA
ncbi:hypothetical protein A2765_04050 [Candidatus Kaiserbacteria bacterium RIFCSPHIGHO2_01_FULL_56_24]|uniref:Uncharacterized protein n=1 Tax=Candidatus Kaiserbacteria bacterium RIFCSPHIGHO2_01_FULL_56_24 TaxID=1798487 RepID=A0A1F6DE66_9BACT|nr:MAG: hypothetical protein A2765_04050 [Candidatus Kaiserbacteria bacterium RIFCSPHIGHO2_01_FULL_56_24]